MNPKMSASSSKLHFLPLPHPAQSRGRAPPYAQPVLLTTYSHLPDRSIEHSDASMAYYRQAPLGADLNYGYERRIERDENEEEHLDGLCWALKELEERQGADARRRGGVVTWRGMITRCVQRRAS